MRDEADRRRSSSRVGAIGEPQAAETRNIAGDHALQSVCNAERTAFSGDDSRNGTMATRRHQQIIETPTEARQAEPGPSVLALLAISTGLAILILGVVWFVFFRT